MTQTAYAEQAALVAGQLLDMRSLAGDGKASKIAVGGIKPGTVVFHSDQDQDTVQDPPALTPTVDVDGLVATPVAMATTPTTISGAALDGLIGPGPHPYGARVTVALNSHVDWNATHLVVNGRDAHTGRIVTEKMDVPDAGNVTLTTDTRFDRVDSIVVEGQAGANATLTAGWTTADYASKAAIAGIAVRKAMAEPVSGEMQFADEDTLSVLRRGGVACEIDQDLSAGGDLFMRVTASTAELAGSLRADSDSGDAVRLPPEFQVLRDADQSALALAEIEVSLP